MSDMRFVFEIAIFALMFLISSTIPIYAFIKSKVTAPFFCSLISLGCTVLLSFLYSVSPLPQGKTGEFYEVFWLMPPIFVLITTIFLSKIKGKSSVKGQD